MHGHHVRALIRHVQLPSCRCVSAPPSIQRTPKDIRGHLKASQRAPKDSKWLFKGRRWQCTHGSNFIWQPTPSVDRPSPRPHRRHARSLAAPHPTLVHDSPPQSASYSPAVPGQHPSPITHPSDYCHPSSWIYLSVCWVCAAFVSV